MGLAPLLFTKEPGCCCCWFPSLTTGSLASPIGTADDGSLVVMTSGRSFSFNSMAEFCSSSSWTSLERLTVIASPRVDAVVPDWDNEGVAMYCCRTLFDGVDVAHPLLRRCCWCCCRCLLGSLDGLTWPILTLSNVGSLSDLSEGVVGAEK